MATQRFQDDDPNVDGLYADLAAADLQPLWRQEGLLPRTPQRLTPHLWRGKTLRDLAERSGELIGIDRGGDRRVLALAHPDLDGLPFATHTLWGAVQYLAGGELAPAHRHSPAALRFTLQGSGVWTLVNGDALHMAPGDLVLTPSWTWHEHHNPGTEPMLWFDALDLPLVRNLDAVFFEPGGEELSPYQPEKRSRSEHHFTAPGLLPLGAGRAVTVEEPGSDRFSHLLAYRWETVDAALSSLLRSTGHQEAAIRYTDPGTGHDIMPTLRAELHRVLAGHRTASTRRAGSAIYVVFHGSGASVIGGRRFSWNAGDMFVVPSWAAVDHEAEEDADLFRISDEPVLEALGLARTEQTPSQQIPADRA
ncbi:cupin domain-containing protein [Streptomyces sp. NPDC091287]|uniref:cupin domain-containing protein n=1 Tax=Streptomyces sp. NPDC091287 TaxID=3365988 RepID=UPI00380F5F05